MGKESKPWYPEDQAKAKFFKWFVVGILASFVLLTGFAQIVKAEMDRFNRAERERNRKTFQGESKDIFFDENTENTTFLGSSAPAKLTFSSNSHEHSL